MTLEIRNPEVKQLLTPPSLSLPSLALFGAGMGALVVSTAFLLTGKFSGWPLILLHTYLIYVLFQVQHDAAHHALSTSPWLNNLLGSVVAFLMVPGANAFIFRWVHLQHHRFTGNPERDPDWGIYEPTGFKRSINWLLCDFYPFPNYIKYLVREQRTGEIFALIAGQLVMVALFMGLSIQQYWPQFLLYWVVPSRLASLILHFTFAYLPHYPGNIRQADHRYQATRIQVGPGWWWTPLLLYQNYHLIHHLFPRVPWYRHRRLFHLLEADLRSKGAIITPLLEGWGHQRLRDEPSPALPPKSPTGEGLYWFSRADILNQS